MNDLTKITKQQAQSIKAQLNRIEKQLERIEAMQRFALKAQPIAAPPVACGELEGTLQ